jgi:hypothetical protein
VTRNLNKVNDINFYPVEEARNSNMRHRCVRRLMIEKEERGSVLFL